jgi:hypothetical protein
MGSGTTLGVAYKLGRIPIGTDIGLISINTTLQRCEPQCKSIYDRDMNVCGITSRDIEDYNILIENIDETKKWSLQRFRRVICMLEGGTSSLKSVNNDNKDGRMPTGDIIRVKHNVKNKVGLDEIRKFSKTLTLNNERCGVLIAYSFTKDAIKEAKKMKKMNQSIVLKTPEDYAELIKVVNNIDKKIKQEIEDQESQFNLDDF